MKDEASGRIKAGSFTGAFEQMCNFVAVAKTGDPRTTVRSSIL